MIHPTLPIFLSTILLPNMALATTIIDSKKDLIGINKHHVGTFFPYGISADGAVVVGETMTNNRHHAGFWTASNNVTNLRESLPSHSSIAYATSLTGDIIVGAFSPTENEQQAFRWTSATGVQPLQWGTLQVKNSSAQGVSADGSVIVGYFNPANGNNQAFCWAQDNNMLTLGTLKSDNSGFSMANAVSADGHVVIGLASIGLQNDIDYPYAFRWTQTEGMQSLGSLKSDGMGLSSADAVSADGSVIVGSAMTDSESIQAFRWTQKNGMQNIGTLKEDNSGTSTARGISADGLVVVGEASTNRQQPSILSGADENDINEMQSFAQQSDMEAFYWTEKIGMQGLGSLRSDNLGFSTAYGISADGSTVVGYAENDQGEYHPIIWKIKQHDIKTIDAIQSRTAMVQTGQRGFNVIDLYQDSLSQLIQSRCQLDQQEHCIALFSQSNRLNNNKRVATGITASTRLPAENWLISAAINFTHHTSLADNYKTRGHAIPALSGVIGYQQYRDGSGLKAELSVAGLQQKLTITRDQLKNSEMGKGNAKIQGYQTLLNIGLGLPVNVNTLLTPEAAISYTNIARTAYIENSGAEFAAHYGKLGHQHTAAKLGLNALHRLTKHIDFDGKVGLNIKLRDQSDDFTGTIPYIGSVTYHQDQPSGTTAYLGLGMNIAVTERGVARVSAAKQSFNNQNNAMQMALNYSWQW